MQVILLERVHNLGNLGQNVNVKAGYGRNYLIPEGKAVYATRSNIEKFEARREELEKKAAQRLSEAQERADKIRALTFSCVAKASDEGKLFGSITVRDVADLVTKAGVTVSKSEIHMPTGPIRLLGEHTLELQLHSDVVLPITIRVEPE
jgi:large subunit ribosomal protein L9